RSVGDWQQLELELIAEQTGYVRASVSSQSATPSYTDNLKFAVLPVAKPEILQENHYYPFGMSLVGIEERDLQSVQGAEEYRFLFSYAMLRADN
ncbi:MAG: hypothetical protein JJT94_16715, partial [Bernardetiaceae bacterium]|nr:hypothetical protein [Bernardetiaceae bacterium]